MKKREIKLGFSLIELLVVIFIIILISGSVLANYGSGQRKYYVSKTSQQLASDLRRAQNMALAGKTQGGIAPKGYGIHINSANQYLIFYNTDTSKLYQGGGVSVILETINTEGGVALSPASYDIYFAPPEPLIYLQGSNSGSYSFTVSLGASSKTVSIDVNGKIETN